MEVGSQFSKWATWRGEVKVGSQVGMYITDGWGSKVCGLWGWVNQAGWVKVRGRYQKHFLFPQTRLQVFKRSDIHIQICTLHSIIETRIGFSKHCMLTKRWIHLGFWRVMKLKVFLKARCVFYIVHVHPTTQSTPYIHNSIHMYLRTHHTHC